MSDRMKKAFMISVFILVVLVFAGALIQLFALRFESGDHLPPYSSLRSDPLGTKAFYESLARFEQLQLNRYYKNLSRLEPDSHTAVFFIALHDYYLSFVHPKTAQTLDRIMVDGGRMVITMYPDRHHKKSPEEKDVEEEQEDKKPETAEPETADQEKDIFEDEDQEDETEEEPAKDGPKRVDLREHWGVEIETASSSLLLNGNTARGKHEAASWPDISWHSDAYFTNLDPAWHTLYAVGSRPVVIWRKWGRGTLVLASDTYFVSNEALRKEPRPKLLSWLVGNKTRIVFNETHLGMYESPGVASLARKYGLGGVLAALLVLAGLFVWKNTFSLVPPADDDTTDPTGIISAGRDYYAGLISLLQRNIPPNRILRECFKAYRRTTEERRENLGDALEKAEAALGTDERSGADPVAGYRVIHQIIAEKKSWKKAQSS